MFYLKKQQVIHILLNIKMNFNNIMNTAAPLLDKEGWMNSFSEFRRGGRKYKHISK